MIHNGKSFGFCNKFSLVVSSIRRKILKMALPFAMRSASPTAIEYEENAGDFIYFLENVLAFPFKFSSPCVVTNTGGVFKGSNAPRNIKYFKIRIQILKSKQPI